MSEKQLKWLKSKDGYLNISKIEIDLKMPEGTLRKFLKGERNLAERWKPKVAKWIKNFTKQ